MTLLPRKYTWRIQPHDIQIRVSESKLFSQSTWEKGPEYIGLSAALYVGACMYFKVSPDGYMLAGLVASVLLGAGCFLWRLTRRIDIQITPNKIVTTTTYFRIFKKTRSYRVSDFDGVGFWETYIRTREERDFFAPENSFRKYRRNYLPHSTLYLIKKARPFLPLMSLPISNYQPAQIKNIFEKMARQLGPFRFLADLTPE